MINDIQYAVIAFLFLPILASQSLIIFSLGNIVHKMKYQQAWDLKSECGERHAVLFESSQMILMGNQWQDLWLSGIFSRMKISHSVNYFWVFTQDSDVQVRESFYISVGNVTMLRPAFHWLLDVGKTVSQRKGCWTDRKPEGHSNTSK